MRDIITVVSIIFMAASIFGCRRDDVELKNFEKVGNAWAFVGTPGQPRAIIRIEENPPHTILISEGHFLNIAEGTARSGDAQISLSNMVVPDDQRTVLIPKGRTAVIDNAGIFNLLEPDNIKWDGKTLTVIRMGGRFDDLLEALVTESQK